MIRILLLRVRKIFLYGMLVSLYLGYILTMEIEHRD